MSDELIHHMRGFAEECLRRIELNPEVSGNELHTKQTYVDIMKLCDRVPAALATFLEGLRELSAEWPHDFTKLSGPHDGAEKAKCKRCQIEKRLGERVTGGRVQSPTPPSRGAGKRGKGQ